ncbi:MAG TPA: tetratricopeptide repeat protein [Polyangiaceae bacterium]|nr:tetratricopeptide repeat protein [Polyangiaceae bacterium]
MDGLKHLTDDYLKTLDEAERSNLVGLFRRWGLDNETFLTRLDQWFTNFDTREDKTLALKLIKSVDYFSPSAFSDLLQRRKQTLDRLLHELGSRWDDVILVQPDGAADSAHSHSYSLTKEWHLPRERVASLGNVESRVTRQSVLLMFNDTHGSGNQFHRTMWPRLSTCVPKVKACVVVAATIAREAHEKFRKNMSGVHIVPETCAMTVFDVFNGREVARLRELGERVYPEHPLGYGNTGLLVAYYFQCPNNSVSVLWADKENASVRGKRSSPWTAVFVYRPKLRNSDESENTPLMKLRETAPAAYPASPPSSPTGASVEEHRGLREAATLLGDARREHNPAVTKRALERASAMIASDPSLKQIERARVLHAEILRELALESQYWAERSQHWNRAMEALEPVTDPRLVLQSSDIVIAYVQDPFSGALKNQKKRLLDHYSRRCESIARENQEPLKSHALRCRSALLRHRALQTMDPHGKDTRRLLEEAGRAARAADPCQIGSAAVLELALAEWALARVQSDDRAYADRCRVAEAEFRNAAADTALEVARYALARFYRMTFRPLSACTLFERLLNQAGSLSRAHLREVHLYGEAASELARTGWPASVFTPHLTRAEHVLERALSAGVRDARTIITLASVRRYLGTENPETSLGAILGAVHKRSWTEVGTLASEQLRKGDDLPSLGLALGMDSGSTWTSLGTYIRRFYKDEAMAQVFYGVALTLDPTNVFARTNRARALLERGELAEAQREISKVPQHADRRFIWWRWIQAEIDERLTTGLDMRPSVPSQAHTIRPPGGPRRFSDVRPLLESALAETGEVERTGKLNSVFDDLVILTPALVPVGSGRFRLDEYEIRLAPQPEAAPADSSNTFVLVLGVDADDSAPCGALSLTTHEVRDVVRQRVLLDQLIGLKIAQLRERT